LRFYLTIEALGLQHVKFILNILNICVFCTFMRKAGNFEKEGTVFLKKASGLGAGPVHKKLALYNK